MLKHKNDTSSLGSVSFKGRGYESERKVTSHSFIDVQEQLTRVTAQVSLLDAAVVPKIHVWSNAVLAELEEVFRSFTYIKV